MSAKAYYSGSLPFDIESLPFRSEPEDVLMVRPDCYNIVDEKNVHMKGMGQKLDRDLAQQQWSTLLGTYESLQQSGLLRKVHVMDGAAGCEDMVFCANQSLPWVTASGDRVAVMSNMRHPSRQREVSFIQSFYEQQQYRCMHFSGYITFEGMGDVIPQPGRRLLFGGYGQRTAKGAYIELSEMLDTPVVALQLVNPNFYHLDTCFLPISDTAVAICKEAFSTDGYKMIYKLFEEVYEIPEPEATGCFSLNAHLIHNVTEKVAILQKGSETTRALLSEKGFRLIELDTSEFMKSGGSVFCMKMMLY
ncbi:MAG: hypothetical protein EOP49_11370 [Sphingobacteriales bacterium]|nr:MAG: hypothetical protein EOP49_11370 [Sphingobacteriales bacterium]